MQLAAQQITYQYSVTVNDSVEPVSDGEDSAFPEFVPDSLLDEAVGSKRTKGNTTPQQKQNSLPIEPEGNGFTWHKTMAQSKGMCSCTDVCKLEDLDFTKMQVGDYIELHYCSTVSTLGCNEPPFVLLVSKDNS